MNNLNDKEDPTLFSDAMVWGAIGLWVTNSLSGGLTGGQGFLLFACLVFFISAVIDFIIRYLRRRILLDFLELDTDEILAIKSVKKEVNDEPF